MTTDIYTQDYRALYPRNLVSSDSNSVPGTSSSPLLGSHATLFLHTNEDMLAHIERICLFKDLGEMGEVGQETTSYPLWLNAITPLILLLFPVGMLALFYGWVETGLLLNLTGFISITIFGFLANKLRRTETKNQWSYRGSSGTP